MCQTVSMHVRQLGGHQGLGAFPCNGSTTFVLARNGTIAAPCSLDVLGKFQGLQRAINNYSQKHSLGIVLRVDGDIGPNTVDASGQVWDHGFRTGITLWPEQRPETARDLAANIAIYELAVSLAVGIRDVTADQTISAQTFGGPSITFGEPTITKLPDAQAQSEAKQAGVGTGAALFLAAAAGVIAYRVVGRKRRGQ